MASTAQHWAVLVSVLNIKHVNEISYKIEY